MPTLVGGLGAGFGRGLHRADVAVDDDGDQAVADLLAADDGDVRRLDHGVGGCERRDKTLGFDHADALDMVVSPSISG